METVLTIAGSDSIGGAGIQADIKTITCNGAYAMSAITAMTAQNTLGVKSIQESTPEFLADQIDAVFTDIVPDAVKIGMVSNPELIKVIAEKLKFYRAKNIVIDPVMVATSGSKLIADKAVETLTAELFPIATLITPNIPEAEILCGNKITSEDEMVLAAKEISTRYGINVLVKGGHSINDANDVLYGSNEFLWFTSERIENENTHGTGCTLSSAIATYLAKENPLECAVQLAKNYITECLKAGLDLGHGSGPMMHNYIFSNKAK
ncbi:bifunctional hydroxymethylpyrimidine kinase/phosphomethylpyrimidine kinase [Treponema sp.]|uniref:bifunctional hydroxymethylpyrimidine kinase/phosphomethylpyrimidine kinase n=1 Tax=Treponema sp. TaxID=166 RepID=UPI00298E51B4|nr:bifunctional hydroxymethylpyrimidine kinase/phosphomethylpyrimidine kinase [Treponema sp.]MCQ2241780.1 bifunctional hydroxymethylpyrimidine kinase/phosphomethylpyrimidine kinase [Treponema sp.]